MPRNRLTIASWFTRLVVAAFLQAVVIPSSPVRCSAHSAFVTSKVAFKCQGPLFRNSAPTHPKDRRSCARVSSVSASFAPNQVLRRMSADASSSATASDEIVVVHQPDEEFLRRKGVFDWGTWGCGVSKFPWTYDSSESCYLLAGKVTVTPADGRQPATFGKASTRSTNGTASLRCTIKLLADTASTDRIA